ncbi:MAG: hypothetical protein JO302_01820, partial [Candidatus Eremiobacteraeota bacterium]|nr:hypothetical protein [Candidatus Eremiobacteraeota bacterium]
MEDAHGDVVETVRIYQRGCNRVAPLRGGRRDIGDLSEPRKQGEERSIPVVSYGTIAMPISVPGNGAG